MRRSTGRSWRATGVWRWRSGHVSARRNLDLRLARPFEAYAAGAGGLAFGAAAALPRLATLAPGAAP